MGSHSCTLRPQRSQLSGVEIYPSEGSREFPGEATWIGDKHFWSIVGRKRPLSIECEEGKGVNDMSGLLQTLGIRFMSQGMSLAAGFPRREDRWITSMKAFSF